MIALALHARKKSSRVLHSKPLISVKLHCFVNTLLKTPWCFSFSVKQYVSWIPSNKIISFIVCDFPFANS